MIKFILILLASVGLTLAESPPLPQLITFFDRDELVFGMWWVSAGSEYNYILEVNEDDGWGWFEVAIWEAPPRGAVMSGYTVTSGNAIGRVRVDRVEPQPSPRGVINWKVLTPVKF
tara:strand:- start:3939 stop:4286 length:348 start_codon:yes stop_codon:yes gene_type:complete